MLFMQRLGSPVCCVIVFIVSVIQICTHPDKSLSPVIVSQWVILPDPGPPTVLFMGNWKIIKLHCLCTLYILTKDENYRNGWRFKSTDNFFHLIVVLNSLKFVSN